MNYKIQGKTKIEPIRPSCRKKIYDSQEDAIAMIRYINETRTARDLHAYKCIVCGFWHLTSK
jgi:hypothetical protein